MSAKTLKSEVVAAAVATSGCGPEGVEVVEGAEVEQAFGRLEHLYAQLPAMEEKGAALARARSAATVDGLAKAAAYRAAELVRADALVTEAEARVSAAEAEGEQAAGEARLALMAAGTQRGLRVGPAQNAEQALARALEASPFDTVEEARAAMLPAESLAALAAEVEAYQPAHAFMRLRVARESWPKKGHQLALRAPFLATALPFAKVGCACSVFPLIRGLRLVARRGDARR